MDITNKPGPTSKRKYKSSCHLDNKIFSAVAIFLVILPKINAQSLYDLYCEDEILCIGESFEIPYPRCINNTCSCLKDSCVHYTTVQNEYIDYYCGECGTIGSICTENVICKYPGDCYGGFCRCRNGYLVDDVCLRFEPISTSTTSIVLISLLIFILLLNKLIVSFEAIKNLCCRIVRCRFCGRGEDSEEEDPDLEWALELSTQLARTEVDRRLTLSDSFRFTQRNRRNRVHGQQQSSSPYSSNRSTISSLSSYSTPISSGNSTLYRTASQTARHSGRRRGYYSLFHENENTGEEVILTRILNGQSRRTSESSEDFIETTFQSIASTVDTEGTSGTPSSPASMKRMNLSEETAFQSIASTVDTEGTSGTRSSPASLKRMNLSKETSGKEQASTSRVELETFRRLENSDNDSISSSSKL